MLGTPPGTTVRSPPRPATRRPREPRPPPRLLQGLALLAVVAAGAWGWRQLTRPDRFLLVRLAEEKLRSIFGSRVEYDQVTVDPVRGVTITGLRVSTPRTDRPTLEARRVTLRHDVIALASGVYRPEEIRIESARIVTLETSEGAELDFPFRLTTSDTEGGLPVIRVVDGTVLYRAMEGSARLRSGGVLTLGQVRLDVTPTGGDWLRVQGGFQTRGLGQDDVTISVEGSANVASDTLSLTARWNPLTLTPHLLQHLAPDVAARLERQTGNAGRLDVTVTRDPEAAEGRIRVGASFAGRVRIDLDALPGVDSFAAADLDQLRSLFESGVLSVLVTPETIVVQQLATSLGSGSVTATGQIEEGGEILWLDLSVKGLRLDDPAVRQALGADGEEIFRAFSPSGVVDADVRVRKERGKPLRWEVDAILEDASFRYFGTPSPDGSPNGFPYPVVQATGRVRVVERGVRFEDIVGLGRNGKATVRLRSAGEEAWTGGETGRILFSEGGTDVRLTVEGTNVPVDRDLDEAIDASEFATLRQEFLLEGTLERVEVDVTRVPGRDDKAYAEVRITLDDERFRYRRFPLPLEGVRGFVTFRRPFVDGTKRGKAFAFEVAGRVEGADLRLAASYLVHEDRGRLHVTGKGVPLGGGLSESIVGSETTREGLGRVWRWLGPRGDGRRGGGRAPRGGPGPSPADRPPGWSLDPARRRGGRAPARDHRSPRDADRGRQPGRPGRGPGEDRRDGGEGRRVRGRWTAGPLGPPGVHRDAGDHARADGDPGGHGGRGSAPPARAGPGGRRPPGHRSPPDPRPGGGSPGRG